MGDTGSKLALLTSHIGAPGRAVEPGMPITWHKGKGGKGKERNDWERHQQAHYKVQSALHQDHQHQDTGSPDYQDDQTTNHINRKDKLDGWTRILN